MEQQNLNEGHYQGFWIEWYDEMLAAETLDIEFYSSVISAVDAPVLELACGTGRLLESLLVRGIETHGLDLSQGMLNICRRKLAAIKLDTKFYRQDFITLSLPQSYRTIFISGGSFQLTGGFEPAALALKKIYEALEPGGRFICDLWIPWDELIKNEQSVWKTGRIAEREDGSKLVVSYFKEFNHAEQVQSGEFKYELYEHGELTRTQIQDMKLAWFGVNEFSLMLEKAGFSEVETETRPIMSSHGISTVYIAKK